jgi:hypothetical protein
MSYCWTKSPSTSMLSCVLNCWRSWSRRARRGEPPLSVSTVSVDHHTSSHPARFHRAHPQTYSCSPDATHIYDHIETFPTHICHLRLGRTPDELVTYTPSSTIMEDSVAAEEKRGELLGIALKWLRDDRDVRKQRDKERGTERGAKRQGDVSSISATDRAANMH